MSIELADLSNFPPVNGKLAALHKIQTETLPTRGRAWGCFDFVLLCGYGLDCDRLNHRRAVCALLCLSSRDCLQAHAPTQGTAGPPALLFTR